jgi:hypothetical protein
MGKHYAPYKSGISIKELIARRDPRKIIDPYIQYKGICESHSRASIITIGLPELLQHISKFDREMISTLLLVALMGTNVMAKGTWAYFYTRQFILCF